MLYRSFDDERGYPPRFYRSPDEVRRQIKEISNRIKEVNEGLNIREMLGFDAISEKLSPRARAERISELLTYALDAMEELSELNDTLDRLKAEYIEVCALMK